MWTLPISRRHTCPAVNRTERIIGVQYQTMAATTTLAAKRIVGNGYFLRFKPFATNPKIWLGSNRQSSLLRSS